MFLHSPPRQVLWRSSHSSTSAGPHRRKAADGSTSQGQDPVGEVAGGPVPCLGSLAPKRHRPLTEQHSLCKEACGELNVWSSPRLLPQPSGLPCLLAGLLQLPLQCPPWGCSASLSNPGLGWPNPTALMTETA